MYCGACLISSNKRELQNINRCCRGKICKICMERSNYISNYMCFYCNAHRSRYKNIGILKLDKAYKYKITINAMHSFNRYITRYIYFTMGREGDEPCRINLSENGSIKSLEWWIYNIQHNNYIYRLNDDKPRTIYMGSLSNGTAFQIVYIVWNSDRKKNKLGDIYFHDNGNIYYYKWYRNSNGRPLIHRIQLNDSGKLCVKWW